MKDDREKKPGTKPEAWKIALLLIFFSLLANLENAGELVGVIILAMLAFGVGWLISKELKRGNSKSETPAAQSVKIREKLEQIGARQRAAAGEAGSAQRTTYSPENFDLDEYDRRKRLEQLDVFLKNGIIDREEYRRMKERYEKR